MPWPYPLSISSSASPYSQHISSPSDLPGSDMHTSSPALHSSAPLSTNSSAHPAPEKQTMHEPPATHTTPLPPLATPAPYHFPAHTTHNPLAPSTRSAHISPPSA